MYGTGPLRPRVESGDAVVVSGNVIAAVRPVRREENEGMTNPQDSDRTDDKSDQKDERDNRPDSKDELVDEMGEESFPASDPPGAL